MLMPNTYSFCNNFKSCRVQNAWPLYSYLFIISGQLQEIISQAFQKAIEPHQDHIKDLEKIVAAQGEQIATLTSTQEHDVNRICLDIAYDRQRLARLEKVEPQPLQKDRGEILRALIAANGGKMLLSNARQKMHLRKDQFSQMLTTIKDEIEVKPLHSDKRKMVIILKSELV
jgi:hypothetical protein